MRPGLGLSVLGFGLASQRGEALRRPYRAYQDAAALYLLDGARGSTFTLGGPGGSISAAADALGGSISLVGSGLQLSSGSVILSSATPTAELLTTTAGPSSGATHSTHIVVDIASVINDVGALGMVGQRNSAAVPIGIRNAANGSKLWTGHFGVGIRHNSVAAIPTGRSILTLTYTAGGVVSVYIDGVFDSSTTFAFTWPQGLAVGTLSNSFPSPNAALARIAFFGAALSKSQIDRIIAADVGALPAYRTPSVLRAHGDSITAGWGLAGYSGSTPSPLAWPAIAAGLINAGRYEPVTLQNAGVSGSFVDASMASAAAAHRPRARSSVCLIAWGSNDIHIAGHSAATVIANLTAAIAAARAAGFTPVLVTILPRGTVGGAANARADTVNAWMKSSSNCAVIDPASLPRAVDPANPTNYQDGTHPTAVLAADMGALAAPILAPLLK